MNFHFVGLPHTSVTPDFVACAFTERLRKVAEMMHARGHTVYLYAGPQSTARVTEHIPCITEAERQAIVGNRHFVHASFDYSLPHWRKFNQTAIKEIRARYVPGDFLCIIGGLAHKEIVDALPQLLPVEFSIGYGGNFAPFRIWESSSWRHTCWGSQGGSNPNAIDGRWFDAVIPGSFDVETFPFRAVKDDYFVFLGRLTRRKGVGVAVDTCKKIGARLIIAGQGEPDEIPDYGEYVGVLNAEDRNNLLAGARALFCTASYIEPFGNAAVEAQLCGTPVLCSPFGAMVETVEDGRTGFHCHMLREFVQGCHDVTSLDPAYIRERAARLYSTETISAMYQKQFERLLTIRANGAGWYAE